MILPDMEEGGGGAAGAGAGGFEAGGGFPVSVAGIFHSLAAKKLSKIWTAEVPGCSER